MPYSLLPSEGNQGNSGSPSVAANANASPADVQSGLQQNYGGLLSSSDYGNQLPPASQGSSASNSSSAQNPTSPQIAQNDNKDIENPPTGGSIA